MTISSNLKTIFYINFFFLFRGRCNEGSNCPAGNHKIIRNCTRYAPTVCDGCAHGYYLVSVAGSDGDCVACSSPCGSFEETIKDCTTAHDRLCSKKWISIKGVPGKYKMDTKAYNIWI